MSKKLYEQISLSRKQAFKLATIIGKAALEKKLQAAEAELIGRLNQATGLKGPGGASFTATQNRVILAQIRDTLRSLNTGILDVTLDQAGKASDKATEDLFKYLKAADKAFKGISDAPLIIDEAAMFERAKEGVNSSILNRLVAKGEPAKQGILNRYGQAVIDHFEETLSQSLIAKTPWEDVKAKLIASSPFLQGAPVSWAERIVRTETMGAFNRANQEAAEAANETLGDAVKILAATFDDRTGWDSYQVHGQIRRLDEPFNWNGGAYDHPPNRPNDREVVIIHRIAWPIPPYLKWKTNGEVVARYYKQRKSGSPGPRPLMTTIPLERFGKP